MDMNADMEKLTRNIEKVIIGKRSVITNVIVAMLSEGHVLIEDVPGVGKTQLVSALSCSVAGKFNRIQMTPDVMPSDIVGFTMIHPETKKLTYQPGIAFCNFLLADEINRASPKAQSSLLEIMEDHQISIDGQTHILPKPFMTLATQNPIETYGTYHLPEAQMDRFLMRISMGYPTKEDELSILSRSTGENPAKTLTPVLHAEDIVSLQKSVLEVFVHELIKEYIWRIVDATRHNEHIRLGVSPRGGLALQKASKAMALLNNRTFVTPDDVKGLAAAVLSHRIILSPKGKSSFESQSDVIASILETLPAPNPSNTNELV